jgi:hypothetical protein
MDASSAGSPGVAFANLRLKVDDPAAYASDAVARACAPGAHATLWSDNAALAGQNLRLLVFVDPVQAGGETLLVCPSGPTGTVPVTTRLSLELGAPAAVQLEVQVGDVSHQGQLRLHRQRRAAVAGVRTAAVSAPGGCLSQTIAAPQPAFATVFVRGRRDAVRAYTRSGQARAAGELPRRRSFRQERRRPAPGSTSARGSTLRRAKLTATGEAQSTFYLAVSKGSGRRSVRLRRSRGLRYPSCLPIIEGHSRCARSGGDAHHGSAVSSAKARALRRRALRPIPSARRPCARSSTHSTSRDRRERWRSSSSSEGAASKSGSSSASTRRAGRSRSLSSRSSRRVCASAGQWCPQRWSPVSAAMSLTLDVISVSQSKSVGFCLS